ncbi:MAG TPA: response regulator [Candidatus Limnocylindrales bacterium]|jgi:two-component system response regulator|nr:response regulator [Candidatus Limnocylindrales bacterium]
MEPRILHVEDNPDDVMLVGLAFRKALSAVQLEVATDGEKALAALQSNLNSPPACVLLDVKLPSISGFEVLKWIRSQSGLKRLPVVMLTSSVLPSDINRAYDFGANSYLVKPLELDALITLAKTIDLYWLRTNTPPTGET